MAAADMISNDNLFVVVALWFVKRKYKSTLDKGQHQVGATEALELNRLQL